MMVEHPATISVVIPFFRDDRWFPDALRSVLDQTRPADEIIVVDDASGEQRSRSLDGLPESVCVIRLLSNGGPGNAREVGTRAATGALISYIDSDDLWPADFLAKCELSLLANPGVSAVYTGMAKLFPDGRQIEYTEKPAWLDVREAVVRFHAYPSLGMLFRREALLELGGWDVARSAIEDWDLIVRLLDQFGPIPLVCGVFPRYRVQHASGRLNSLGLRKLPKLVHTFRANQELLERAYGSGAARRRFAQAVREIGDRRSGIISRCYRLGVRIIGRPLDLDNPAQ